MHIMQDNLTIRNATMNDAAQLGRWWRDGKIMAHAGFPLGLMKTDDEIKKDLSTDADESFRRLIIEVDSLPVGEMCYRDKGNQTAEIGIKICDVAMQSKGYGTKLLCMLIEVLFQCYGYERIILDADLENKRAQSVYEKIGFRKVSEHLNSWKNQLGELRSAVDYELLKTEHKFTCASDKIITLCQINLNSDEDLDYILECHCLISYECESPRMRKLTYKEYWTKWFSSTSQKKEFLSSLQESMEDTRTIANIVKTGLGKKIGYIWVSFYEEIELSTSWANVQDIYIEEDYRKTGIASYLMKYAETTARLNGANVIRSGTGSENEKSQALHEKLGYYQYRFEYEKVLLEETKKDKDSFE